MEYIAGVLKPIKVVVWGEMAMIYLGAAIIYNVGFPRGKLLDISPTLYIR